jgi:hypothetical protein
VAVVLHFVDPDAAKPYRRKNAPTFVVALAELDATPSDMLRTGYPLLVRGLANLCVMVSPSGTGSIAQFVTLEQGTYAIDTGTDDDQFFFKSVFSRVEPLASSRLVIGNEFTDDLPEAVCAGDEITRQITRAGQRLAALDLLPAAFPIEEILSDRDLRHVKLLYGIGGLSYGNVSARRLDIGRRRVAAAVLDERERRRQVGVARDRTRHPPRDRVRRGTRRHAAARARGRRAAQGVGRRHRALDDLPRAPRRARDPPRARVDRGHRRHRDQLPVRHRRAGASRSPSSCATPRPSRAVVGQRNHGLTITGHSLDEIFDRIDGRIVRKVPMD